MVIEVREKIHPAEEYRSPEENPDEGRDWELDNLWRGSRKIRMVGLRRLGPDKAFSSEIPQMHHCRTCERMSLLKPIPVIYEICVAVGMKNSRRCYAFSP
jgi:hypothetical protein